MNALPAVRIARRVVLVALLCISSETRADVVRVAVAVRTIFAGERIPAAGVRDADWTFAGDAAAYVPSSGAIVGRVARRTILANRPVPLLAVGGGPMVAAGQSVRLVWEDGNLLILSEGLALESARPGEIVRVRPPGGGKPLAGIVTGDGHVRLGVR